MSFFICATDCTLSLSEPFDADHQRAKAYKQRELADYQAETIKDWADLYDTCTFAAKKADLQIASLPMVDDMGIEPTTSALRTLRSPKLSLRRALRSVDKVSFLKSTCSKSFEKWALSYNNTIIGMQKYAWFFRTGLCQQALFVA